MMSHEHHGISNHWATRFFVQWFGDHFVYIDPANVRQHYIITLIGWAHTQNDP